MREKIKELLKDAAKLFSGPDWVANYAIYISPVIKARVGLTATLLDRAEKAHAKYEKRLGQPDEDWADYYAEFMAKGFRGGAS